MAQKKKRFVLIQWSRKNPEELSIMDEGFILTMTHNWVDGSYHPLARKWRTNKCRMLGYPVKAWEKTEWGEQTSVEI